MTDSSGDASFGAFLLGTILVGIGVGVRWGWDVAFLGVGSILVLQGIVGRAIRQDKAPVVNNYVDMEQDAKEGRR